MQVEITEGSRGNLGTGDVPNLPNIPPGFGTRGLQAGHSCPGPEEAADSGPTA